jgi:hypothetical protein
MNALFRFPECFLGVALVEADDCEGVACRGMVWSERQRLIEGFHCASDVARGLLLDAFGKVFFN